MPLLGDATARVPPIAADSLIVETRYGFWLAIALLIGLATVNGAVLIRLSRDRATPRAIDQHRD